MLMKSSGRLLSWWCAGWFWLVVLSCKECAYIEPSKGRFNASIREFADSSERTNTSKVKTLHKQERISHAVGRNKNREFDTLHFKDSLDSDPSSSNRGRGFKFFPQGDFSGHGFNGYEGGYDVKGPVVQHYYSEPGYNDAGHHDAGHYDAGHHDAGHYDVGHYDAGHYDSGHHDSGHHEPHHVGHGHGFYGNHHVLAVKTLLLPLAGIALLGAAAALVTNPVLLQLGVISGRRRRRRDTQHSTDTWRPTWDHTTPLPYRAQSVLPALRDPYAMLTTPTYATPTLPRSWTAGVSEKPKNRNGVTGADRDAKMYELAPKRRGKRN